MEDWLVVYSSNNLQEATLLKFWLQNNGIETFLIDRQDSVYPNLGEIELRVHPDYFEQTLSLIEQHGNSAKSANP